VSVLVRAARPAEAAAISALALRSKGHWGYDAQFLAACRDDLTIRPEWCDGVRLVVAELDGVLLGYARIAGEPPVGELAGLFVDPAAIGRGVGGLLLRHAVRIAAGLGMTAVEIDSDPNAEPFYRHAGAVRIGESPSTVDPNRLLPRLRGRASHPPQSGIPLRRRRGTC
jgi:GNAT superfamily N-acetyltransferase